MPAKHHINYAFFLVKVLCEPWIMQNNQEILLKRWYIFRILRHERPFELSSQGYYRVIRNPQSLKVLNGTRIVSIHHKLQTGKRKLLQKMTIFDETIKTIYLVFVVQLLSQVQIFATPWTAAHQAWLSFNISWSLLKLMSTESVMPSNHLIFCHPFSSCLESSPASGSFQMSWFFPSGGQSIGVSAPNQSFQWIFRADFL